MNQLKSFNNIELDEKIAVEIYSLIKKLFPICRSITGNGVRETLKILQEHIPLEIKDTPTKTQIFDWTIPKEWNIKDAYIKNSKGEKVIDFKNSNLHVLNYSTPINKKISLSELKKHIYTLPKNPDWIPYRTSYYEENWGFCLTQNQLENLTDKEYEVVIDSTLKDGTLTYGEFFIKGKSQEEFLLSCYICHPSMCNDNLSGIALVTFLAKYLKNLDLNYSYRFLFIPETIGAINWLYFNKDTLKIKYGLVASCVGDNGQLTYKKTRYGKSKIDNIVEQVLIESKKPFTILDFFPTGSDERQFCSPGFNLHVGSLMRTPYGKFPEYHTSADNLDFINQNSIFDCFEKYLKTIYFLENDRTYINSNPYCEPQLGKRGIYRKIGAQNLEINELAIFWVLNYSDGTNSLLDISKKSGIEFSQIKNAADILHQSDLLEDVK